MPIQNDILAACEIDFILSHFKEIVKHVAWVKSLKKQLQSLIIIEREKPSRFGNIVKIAVSTFNLHALDFNNPAQWILVDKILKRLQHTEFS